MTSFGTDQACRHARAADISTGAPTLPQADGTNPGFTAADDALLAAVAGGLSAQPFAARVDVLGLRISRPVARALEQQLLRARKESRLPGSTKPGGMEPERRTLVRACPSAVGGGQR